MVFDGEELLEFAIKSIRHVVDYVSVTYQSVSYFGNKVDESLLDLLQRLQQEGLIDDLLYYETDLNIHHKQNELNLRNLGLTASKNAGCTHHISADVDEFYKPDELISVKNVMSNENYDFSMVTYITYYKNPTYLIIPHLKNLITFIHPVDNKYEINDLFPFKIEPTRRFTKYQKCKIFSMDEIVIHHMSFIRKDIRKKLENSDSGKFYNIGQFVSKFNKYKLGDRLCVLPDFLNRRTIEVPNIFNINI